MSHFDREPRRAKGKRLLKHPYAAIEHRVIDSEAFADLRPNSVRLLLILARQLTAENNNGHLQATWSYCRKRGFGSQGTLKSAIEDLIRHGFVYRARSRGPNKIWARYSLTWLPIKQKEGLFLDGFLFDSWKFWKKSTPQKPKGVSTKNCSLTLESSSHSGVTTPSKIDDYELVPIRSERLSQPIPQGD